MYLTIWANQFPSARNEGNKYIKNQPLTNKKLAKKKSILKKEIQLVDSVEQDLQNEQKKPNAVLSVSGSPQFQDWQKQTLAK